MKTNKYIPGDWVKYRGNNSPRYVQIWQVRENFLFLESGYGIVDFSEVEPIPLTLEILLKNGWKNDGIGYDYQLKDKLYLLVEYKDKEHKVINSVEVYNNVSPESYDVGQDDFYLMTISYVHELQHLLFGLGFDFDFNLGNSKKGGEK